jgi:hypothetical protein
MRGGLAETWVMVELGTHCTYQKGAWSGNSPSKTAHAVFLSQPQINMIVYVSCNPATQARDCHFFVNHGYTLQRHQPFDMFPQTSHIEVVVLLVWKIND